MGDTRRLVGKIRQRDRTLEPGTETFQPREKWRAEFCPALGFRELDDGVVAAAKGNNVMDTSFPVDLAEDGKSALW